MVIELEKVELASFTPLDLLLLEEWVRKQVSSTVDWQIFTCESWRMEYEFSVQAMI